MLSPARAATARWTALDDDPWRRLAARVGTLMAERSFEPNFPIHLVAKDLGHAAARAHQPGLEGDVLRAVHSAFERAEQAGFGSDDIARLHINA